MPQSIVNQLIRFFKHVDSTLLNSLQMNSRKTLVYQASHTIQCFIECGSLGQLCFPSQHVTLKEIQSTGNEAAIKI